MNPESYQLLKVDQDNEYIIFEIKGGFFRNIQVQCKTNIKDGVLEWRTPAELSDEDQTKLSEEIARIIEDILYEK